MLITMFLLLGTIFMAIGADAWDVSIPNAFLTPKKWGKYLVTGFVLCVYAALVAVNDSLNKAIDWHEQKKAK